MILPLGLILILFSTYPIMQNENSTVESQNPIEIIMKQMFISVQRIIFIFGIIWIFVECHNNKNGIFKFKNQFSFIFAYEIFN